VTTITSSRTRTNTDLTSRGCPVRLRNTGSHAIFVFRKHGASINTLVAELNGDHAPARRFKDFTARDIVDGHTDAYLRLSRGTYYLANAAAWSYSVSKMHTLIVTGKTRNAALPASSPIGLDAHGVVHMRRSLAAAGYLHVYNGSGKVQEIVLLSIGKNTTAAELAAFAAKPSFEALTKLDVRTPYLGGMLSAHRSAWVNPHLRAGRYLVVDLAVSGSPDAFELHAGHVQAVTVR
jgi:hypothetical protein